MNEPCEITENPNYSAHQHTGEQKKEKERKSENICGKKKKNQFSLSMHFQLSWTRGVWSVYRKSKQRQGRTSDSLIKVLREWAQVEQADENKQDVQLVVGCH